MKDRGGAKMRKLWIAALSAFVLFALTGCGKSEKYEIEIIIPAGSQAEYVYADEEISPTGKEIEIWSGAGLSDTSVVLKPVEVKEENTYEPTYLTHAMPVKMDVEKGAWFQIGVSVQNPSDVDIAVGIEVEGVEVRIRETIEAETEQEELPEQASVQTSGTLIEEQTFEVALNDWGIVTFAAYAPESNDLQQDGLKPDVRFYLMDGEQALYEFPGWNEEHTIADMFQAVSAVAFKDYNDDGLLDVITLCEYGAMSGQGFQTARIYFQLEDKQGFEEDTLLTEYLSKNYHTDSIASIMDAKEEYWDYLSAMDGHRSVYNQMVVMAENKEIWVGNPDYANDLYQYAVADLDHNGRYEIIVANHGGTGRYTYNRFFEINEKYDGLTECETDFVEGDSQPDLISADVKTYIDDNGGFHYLVYDLLRAGAAEYYENFQELVLKDGKVILEPIAYRITTYDPETVTCKDVAGNIISEDDYINAPERYFEGFAERVTNLGWQDVNDLGTEPEKIVAQLQESVDKYANSGQ